MHKRFSRCNIAVASSIFHVLSSSSVSDFKDLDNMKLCTSVWPSIFLVIAVAKNFLLFLMLFCTKNSEIPRLLNLLCLFYFLALFDISPECVKLDAFVNFSFLMYAESNFLVFGEPISVKCI